MDLSWLQDSMIKTKCNRLLPGRMSCVSILNKRKNYLSDCERDQDKDYVLRV